MIWNTRPIIEIPEGCVNVILYMYTGAMTKVKTICGRTECFEVKIALHYGSALSPLCLKITIYKLAEEAGTRGRARMMENSFIYIYIYAYNK